MSTRTDKLAAYAATVAQEETRYKSPTLFPIVDVMGASAGNITVERIQDDGEEDLARAPTDRWYKEGQKQDIAIVPYSCKDWGASEVVDKREKKRLANDTRGMLNLQMSKVAKAVRRTYAADERALQTMLATATNYESANILDGSGTDFVQFDLAGADIFKALDTGLELLLKANAPLQDVALTISDTAVWRAIKSMTSLLTAVSGVHVAGTYSMEEFKAIIAMKLGIKEVNVLDATVKANRKGASKGNRSKNFIGASSNIMCLHINPSTVNAAGVGGQIKASGSWGMRAVEEDYHLEAMMNDGMLDHYAWARAQHTRYLVKEWAVQYKNCVS